MKIKVIIPAASSDFLEANRASRIEMGKGFADIEVINCPDGPASIESALDVSKTTMPLVKAAIKAENEGYDAITIDCAADPSVRAVKDAVSIPVCAAGEASYSVAMMLSDTFSIIAVLDKTTLLIKENISKYGLNNRVTSIVSANVPVLDLESESAFDAILYQAELAKKEGAGAIVLGCTGMSRYTKILSEKLGIPVIDPAAAAIQLAIGLSLGEHKLSKKDFPY
ncbi:aspartate/glutamate racemase family protein [Vibrio sp. SS-MA-C1-2]|uniref:aspartate/glutamate racemase family protein n=1 Tax=Vibrio sp. SS-MA-C1-2 TaxID=2908646 RepID=UPI001F29820B|nr:aspartate/glutamate racemase family protein [Vibrio sp. SS-MA-C1-2]UJF17231.1 aspartate/glutamate racemase family protein [Vibrio sp. SS-MA-C1-2]